jgi:hypothetical protein
MDVTFRTRQFPAARASTAGWSSKRRGLRRRLGLHVVCYLHLNSLLVPRANDKYDTIRLPPYLTPIEKVHNSVTGNALRLHKAGQLFEEHGDIVLDAEYLKRIRLFCTTTKVFPQGLANIRFVSFEHPIQRLELGEPPFEGLGATRLPDLSYRGDRLKK